MTREQQILWAYLKSAFTITGIAKLFYQGAIAGSEFETYAATKLYLCLEFDPGNTGLYGMIQFNNEADAAFHYYYNVVVYWNGTASNFIGTNPVTQTNFYFSRLIRTGYSTMKFIGYRITKT